MPGYEIADSNPLLYTGLEQEGNYASGGRNFLFAARKLDVDPMGPFYRYVSNGKIGKAGETLWLSALVRKDQNNNEEGHFGIQSWPRLLSIGYFGGDSNDGGERYWSLRVGDSDYELSDVPVEVGESTLLVAKIAFGLEQSTVSLYIDPQLGEEPPATADLAAVTELALAFSEPVLYLGATQGQFSIDELRFGTSFSSVAPQGEQEEEEEEEPEEAQRSALIEAIAAASAGYGGALEGDKLGQYPRQAKQALEHALSTAVAVRDAASASQSQVDQAEDALRQAWQEFQGRLVTMVAGQSKLTTRDLAAMLQHFGTSSADSQWEQAARADMDGNGLIGSPDLIRVSQLILDEWLSR